MKKLAAAGISLALMGSAAAYAESTRSRPTVRGPLPRDRLQNFTGSVTVDPLYAANESTSSPEGLWRSSPEHGRPGIPILPGNS